MLYSLQSLIGFVTTMIGVDPFMAPPKEYPAPARKHRISTNRQICKSIEHLHQDARFDCNELKLMLG